MPRARALAVKSRDVFSRAACLSRRALGGSECAYSRCDGTIEPANKTHFRLHVRIIPDYTYASDSTAHYGLTGIRAIQFMYRLVNSLPGNNYIDVIQCALRPSARHCREHRSTSTSSLLTARLSLGRVRINPWRDPSSFFRFAMPRDDMTRIRRPAYHLFGGFTVTRRDGSFRDFPCVSSPRSFLLSRSLSPSFSRRRDGGGGGPARDRILRIIRPWKRKVRSRVAPRRAAPRSCFFLFSFETRMSSEAAYSVLWTLPRPKGRMCALPCDVRAYMHRRAALLAALRMHASRDRRPALVRRVKFSTTGSTRVDKTSGRSEASSIIKFQSQRRVSAPRLIASFRAIIRRGRRTNSGVERSPRTGEAEGGEEEKLQRPRRRLTRR